MMRFEQLEYLIAISETGSFSAAASKLFITQQAISISMKQLEQEVGQTLFHKTSNKTILTQQGEEVLLFAKKILQEKEHLYAQMQVLSTKDAIWNVTVASTSCVANMTLPDIIIMLQAKKQKISLQITQVEHMHDVLEQVQQGEKDIGLVSFNANEFERKFAAYEDCLLLEVLAHDEIVGVINRREFTGKQDCITEQEYTDALKTLYNIEPIDALRIDVDHKSMICSNDADFHRAMLEKTNTIVTMSGLSYQHFFNNKKYIALPIENISVPIIHAAIYRNNADAHIQELIRMIRKEMHLK